MLFSWWIDEIENFLFTGLIGQLFWRGKAMKHEEKGGLQQ